MDATSQIPASLEPAGNVVLMAPVPCGVLSVRSARLPAAGASRPGADGTAAACDPPLLRSGTADGEEFVALLAFDLRALPAGSEVIYAGLELAGLDDTFLDEVGRWTVRAVALPTRTAMADLSFARIMAAPAIEPSIAWQLGRAELAPGGRNTLKLEGDGLRYLAGQLGQGAVSFRIEGPLGETNLFAWEARGASAPRLRIAYTPAEPAAATGLPLIVWDATPPAATADRFDPPSTTEAAPAP